MRESPPGVAVVIPARYGASRLPGKPLAQIDGRPMIWYVWENARKSRCATHVLVATDDERIADAVRGFGGEARMTSPGCTSGTDRVAEAARGLSEEIIINLQGDEPMMDPSVIDAVAGPLLTDPVVSMGTAAIVQEDPEEFLSSSVVKVVVDDRGDALYFSRAPIPHWRDAGSGNYRKHLGIYGYRKDFLLRLSGLPPSSLEKAECLEQLRVLQSGGKIRVVDVTFDSVGVDTPEDLRVVERRICARKKR
ncbi:MAG: 3-deoxy-manno-octulosonate cytidylyltransferase [Deltaproteobacteria bacterium]|nr:3-deoxy-manno-octulosonate cytidylyltransferase [Deltaproteobacteria bacterium]